MGRLTSRIKALRQRHRERQRGDRPLFHLPGGSQDDQVTNELLEEARKQDLRNRIASMFGEDVSGGSTLIREGRTAPQRATGGQGSDDAPPITFDFSARSGQPARAQFAAEESGLTGALQGGYTEDLRKKYADAERALRFGAANTGNVGSTTYADSIARLNEENRLGGTRTGEAIRRAIQGLKGSREETRARAMNLVNAGLGEEGVRATTEGLRAASETARAASRDKLFEDLFQNLAYTRVGENEANRRNQAGSYIRSFFPSRGSSGTVYG
jgi:hypothetical protein